CRPVAGATGRPSSAAYQRPRPPPPPRLPPPPDRSWASLTVSVRPPSSRPFSWSMACLASCSLPISTNAKPRGRPVSRSITILVSATVPHWLNTSRSSSSVVLNERLPTYRRLPIVILPVSNPAELPPCRSLKRADDRPETDGRRSCEAQGRKPGTKKRPGILVARQAPEGHRQ